MIYTIVKFWIFFILIALIILNWFVDVCTQNKLLHEYCIQQNLVYVYKGLHITIELDKNTMLPFYNSFSYVCVVGMNLHCKVQTHYSAFDTISKFIGLEYISCLLEWNSLFFLSTFEIDQLSIFPFHLWLCPSIQYIPST